MDKTWTTRDGVTVYRHVYADGDVQFYLYRGPFLVGGRYFPAR